MKVKTWPNDKMARMLQLLQLSIFKESTKVALSALPCLAARQTPAGRGAAFPASGRVARRDANSNPQPSTRAEKNVFYSVGRLDAAFWKPRLEPTQRPARVPMMIEVI